MVTRWGMSKQVGVVFADYEPGAMNLNMQRIDPSAQPRQAHSLAADADGHLLLNGHDVPARENTFAMSSPAARNTSTSTSMATLIDSEVQSILNEGYEMARALLREHYDQLTQLAKVLMEREQLDRKQFEALLQE